MELNIYYNLKNLINEKWKDYFEEKVDIKHFNQEFTKLCILMDQSNALTFYLHANEYLDEISDLLHVHNQSAFYFLAELLKELVYQDFDLSIALITQRIYRLFELILLDQNEVLNEEILDWILEYFEIIEEELEIDLTELIYNYFNDPVYTPTKLYLAKQQLNKGNQISKWYQRYTLLK